MALFIIAVIVFIIADIVIRVIIKQSRERKIQREREDALKVSLKLDFSKEAKTLKRAEVDNPTANILCVDDEPVILDSFRKILVLDGYSIDTVENGAEALSLIKSHNYDFIFTDLKMPEMDGIDVTKAVKHLRPDIDVIIITGYATVETAVECMKYGAMDYVQKPFTEDELLDFTKKLVIKRNDRIQKQLKPRVHITHFSAEEQVNNKEFYIPGGVFISNNHCWLSIERNGSVKIGMDDLTKKLIGKIDNIMFPNPGIKLNKNETLFTIHQGNRTINIKCPINGQILKVNANLAENFDKLDFSVYDDNWICIMEPENIEIELSELNIGQSAVSLYQKHLDYIKEVFHNSITNSEKNSRTQLTNDMYNGILQELDERIWNKIIDYVFEK